ncbi:MAG: GNAT family N-acetyltransferase [Propionibacteriaceae bacterium]
MTTDWFRPAVLQGPTLRLVPLSIADAADYRRALGRADAAAEVTAHLMMVPPSTDEAAAAIIAASVADPRRIAYGQRLRSTGELVGSTSFYEIDPALKAIAIGYTWLSRPVWRTHVNTESKLIMLHRAFDELGAERVVWHTDIRNTRSQAAIERLGAHREGILRHHRIRPDGSWRDTVQFSMLAAEWPAVQQRLTARAAGDRPGGVRSVVEVRHEPESFRFVGFRDGRQVGLIDYRRQGDVLVVLHTETDPALRGQGIAADLTRELLAVAAAEDLLVRAVCPYTVSYLNSHPQYAHLRA